jgi:DeoR family transcriptional regulator of aga operon
MSAAGPGALRRADRISTILDRLGRQQDVVASELAAEFGVSAATLRRDLQLLEDQHLLARTHGGARAQDLSHELPVRYRGGRHKEAKRAIAAYAAGRLPRGRLTVGLTGGTTISAVARCIAGRVDLTVVTNALDIGYELALRPRLDVIMTGGITRTQTYELVGPMADRTLADLNLQIAVVGADGVSTAGLTTHDLVEAHTNQVMISRAERVMVVADGSKIGATLVARMCPLADVAELITDTTADPEAVAQLRRAGLDVHLVPVPERPDPG